MLTRPDRTFWTVYAGWVLFWAAVCWAISRIDTPEPRSPLGLVLYFLFLAALPLLFPPGKAFESRRIRRAEPAWREVALELGLAFKRTPRGMIMAGRVSGLGIRVATDRYASSIELPPHPSSVVGLRVPVSRRYTRYQLTFEHPLGPKPGHPGLLDELEEPGVACRLGDKGITLSRRGLEDDREALRSTIHRLVAAGIRVGEA
jgi:hypothetical protein